MAHIQEPAYGYEPDEMALTGLARFDGLKSNDQKQILITPTWRKSCCGTGMLNEVKGYNPLFKQSAYFKVYNSLINDEKLIACAEKTGYKLIFLLHPAMSSQISDYDTNDYVELIQASGDMSYEKILTESSLIRWGWLFLCFIFPFHDAWNKVAVASGRTAVIYSNH